MVDCSVSQPDIINTFKKKWVVPCLWGGFRASPWLRWSVEDCTTCDNGLLWLDLLIAGLDAPILSRWAHPGRKPWKQLVKFMYDILPNMSVSSKSIRHFKVRICIMRCIVIKQIWRNVILHFFYEVILLYEVWICCDLISTSLNFCTFVLSMQCINNLQWTNIVKPLLNIC